MALTATAPNEHGTPVAEGNCDVCGHPYTVCPAPDMATWTDWATCQGTGCASYDITRDVDMFFAPLAEAGLIGRRPR